MNSDNLPTEYKEYLEFLENNTHMMVAEIWENYYVPQTELESLIGEWRKEAKNAPHEMCAETLKAECADELEAVLTDND